MTRWNFRILFALIAICACDAEEEGRDDVVPADTVEVDATTDPVDEGSRDDAVPEDVPVHDDTADVADAMDTLADGRLDDAAVECGPLSIEACPCESNEHCCTVSDVPYECSGGTWFQITDADCGMPEFRDAQPCPWSPPPE